MSDQRADRIDPENRPTYQDGPLRMQLVKDIDRYRENGEFMALADAIVDVMHDDKSVAQFGVAVNGSLFLRLGKRAWLVDKAALIDRMLELDAEYVDRASGVPEREHGPVTVGAIRKAIAGLSDDTPCYPDWAFGPPDDHEPGVIIEGFRRIEQDYESKPCLSILVSLAYLEDWDTEDDFGEDELDEEE